MSAGKRYLDIAREKLDGIMEREMEHIEQAAQMVADSCLAGGRFYAFGTGHSHLIAEELYLRAGGLALVRAILPPEMMLHEMPNKSTYLERLEGYAEAMAQLYEIDEKDTILVVSNSGRNAVPVEMCMAAKARGAKVIALTSMAHSGSCQSRHVSGKKMYEIADVTIDNGACPGDAALAVDGLGTCIGPTSDVTGVAIAQALVCEAVERMVKAGMDVPVFKSSNVDGGDAYNEELFRTYYGYRK